MNLEDARKKIQEVLDAYKEYWKYLFSVEMAKALGSSRPVESGEKMLDSSQAFSQLFQLVLDSEYGRVRCGDCEKGKVPYPSKDEALHDEIKRFPVDCPTCSGTGCRAVMVRRECEHADTGVACPKSWPCEDYDDFCFPLKGKGIRTPFTPADLLDVIEGRATLELEVKG